MKPHKYIPLFVLLAFLVNVGFANSSGILGSVMIYTPSSGTENYPLISGNKMAYDYKALIKVSGGTLVADSGTVIETMKEGETVAFKVDKGKIYFQLLPHKVRVSFKTRQGDIFMPAVVPASTSLIEGRIVVSENNTKIELTEGTLEAQTSKGFTKINAGREILLAQAEISDVTSGLQALMGEVGTVVTPLAPEGTVQIGGQSFNARVLTGGLEEGTVIEVVGVEGSTLIVREVPKVAGATRAEQLSTYAVHGAAYLFSALCAQEVGVCEDDDDDEEASPIVE